MTERPIEDSVADAVSDILVMSNDNFDSALYDSAYFVLDKLFKMCEAH